MKKYFKITLATLLSMVIISSCKKDTTTAAKDYNLSIKNKTWCGMLTYTGQTTEYYSVHFYADNTLLWSQLSGDYPGQWAVDGKQLTMIFPGISSEIKADISDDDELMNISDNNASFTINTGELIPNPTISLDNTIWKGTINLGTSAPFQLSFTPGSKVDLKIDNTTYAALTYTRSSSGAIIHIYTSGNVFFGVVASDTEMKGNNGFTEYPWQAIKQ